MHAIAFVGAAFVVCVGLGVLLAWAARRPEASSSSSDLSPADCGIAGEVEGWLRQTSTPVSDLLPVIPGREINEPWARTRPEPS